MKNHAHNQGAQLTRKAKRSSAANHDGSGLLGSVVGRRSAATRDASRDAKGSGAPPAKLLGLLAISLIALFATAAPASAASLGAKMETVSEVSYATAHVTGKVSSSCSGFCSTDYNFQYATSESGPWKSGPGGSLFGLSFPNPDNEPVQSDFEGLGLSGGTKYFVRLVVSENGVPPEAIDPTSPPYPSFTTLVADPPVVEATDNATDIEYTTASVSGKVIRPEKSDDLKCDFEYITDDAYQGNPVGDRFAGATPVACDPNPVATVGSSEVKASLTGLANATTYHLRIAVSNASAADAKEAASTFTTQAVTPPTVVSVEDATNVFSRQADAAGVIKRPANPDPAFDIVDCHFEYVTQAQFEASNFVGAGTAPCVEPINNGPDEETPVTATLTGLDAETTYHLRLAAGNAAATLGTKEAASTFTTTAKVAKPTVLSIQNATGVDQDTAKVSGEVEGPTGGDPAYALSCRFEYVTEASFQGNEEQSLTIVATGGTYTVGFKGSSTPSLAFDASPASVQAALAALPGIGAGNVSVRGGPGNITGVAPYLVVFSGALAGQDVEALTIGGPSQAVVLTSAEGGHAPGFVNPTRTDCDPVVAGAGPQEAKVNVSGLLPDTTYHLRLTAENGGGTDSKDAAATFTTDPNLPASAVVGPITEISYGGATLSGETDVEGYPFSNSAAFEVSTDGILWTNFTPTGGGGYTKLEPVQPLVMTGLKGATKYFVRLRRVDCSTGGDCTVNQPTLAVSQPPYPSFTTLPVDPATVLKANDATDVTSETAKVSGEIERPANPDPAFDANCHFDYVTEAQFQADGYQNALQVPCGIDSLTTPGEKKAVEAELTDLKSGTKYHFRLIATNAGPDASLEAANTFTTVAVPVTAAQSAGASDGEGGYFLVGQVNPHNSTISDCKFVYGPTSETDFKKYPFAVPCSPTPDAVSKPVTVEGHVTGLTADTEYHSRLVVTNGFGTEVTPDQGFTPNLATKQPCPANEQLRKENSSLALPECRAYELVTPMGKEGFGATLRYASTTGSYDGGDRVAYLSKAGNLAKSGQGGLSNRYVAERNAAGWQTIPDLNGSSGSFHDAPTNAEGFPTHFVYSQDLLSSVWQIQRQDEIGAELRSPDGTFALIGLEGAEFPAIPVAASADLSHLLVWGWSGLQSIWGPGVYEFLGTGMDQPRRVDLDNSGAPISTCLGTGQAARDNAVNLSLSSDASTIVNYVFGGCGGSNPPADELWARVNGTTSIDVSTSHCTRLDCNAPSNPTFQGAASDGSRVFFTTTQQLVDQDIDQTNDIYACDLPAGNPAPSAQKANPCSAFRQISVADVGAAEVESVFASPPPPNGIASGRYPGVSGDGSTVLFTAKGVLAANEDALGEKALAGDHNLYLWRATDDNPDGQTAFVARLEKNDLGTPQLTPDGRYLLFTTANQLLDTDTDSARDVYRYDVDAGTLTRVSTNVFGVAGNGDFDAQIGGPVEHHLTTAISDDGTKIVFTTTEPLKLAVDNNDQPDVYLWTPDRVSLITTGSVNPDFGGNEGGGVSGFIDGSGQNIYFTTTQQLTPADGDDNGDVYDARIGGGFSFAPSPICTGEKCQPDPTPAPPKKAPLSAQPDPGNPTQPKPCPKGKVRKKNGKCVPKHHKKHHKKSHKRAGHNRGGSK